MTFNRVHTCFFVGAAILSLAGQAVSQSAVTTTQSQSQSPATSTQVTPVDKRKPVRRPTAVQTTVTVIPSQAQVAPQVVTIIHRLTGVKLLRYLLRQGNQGETTFTIDPESISNDAHASIIAGWALDDGKTIAARLPQAGAEIEFGQFPLSRFEPGQLTGPMRQSRAVAQSRLEPDLTVITNDGHRFRARYVGLDGETGLSILQVSGTGSIASVTNAAGPIADGQKIHVFAPERASPEGEAAAHTIYVKVVETEAKISDLARSRAGELQKLTVQGQNLSPVLLGGIACDQAGNTLGIVDAFEGNDARVVPANSIRAATRRVLERQASVPRPLLGVRGEPVDLAAASTFLTNGWPEDQLKELQQNQLGILLTLVMPGTPAALAKLKAGDVILSVNKAEIKSAEEFSQLLSQAGSGAQVQFAVRRPGAPTTLPIDVRLGGSFDSLFEWHFEMPALPTPQVGLSELGIETATLSTESVLHLGAQNGLLVVAVQPESPAAHAGIQEGDVIESIDGRPTRRAAFLLRLNDQKKHTLTIIRNREKKQIVLEPSGD